MGLCISHMRLAFFGARCIQNRAIASWCKAVAFMETMCWLLALSGFFFNLFCQCMFANVVCFARYDSAVCCGGWWVVQCRPILRVMAARFWRRIEWSLSSRVQGSQVLEEDRMKLVIKGAMACHDPCTRNPSKMLQCSLHTHKVGSDRYFRNWLLVGLPCCFDVHGSYGCIVVLKGVLAYLWVLGFYKRCWSCLGWRGIELCALTNGRWRLEVLMTFFYPELHREWYDFLFPSSMHSICTACQQECNCFPLPLH